jgi:hypothetical protein
MSESDYAMIINRFKRLGTSKPPHALTTRPLYDADASPTFKPIQILRIGFDAVPLEAAAV